LWYDVFGNLELESIVLLSYGLDKYVKLSFEISVTPSNMQKSDGHTCPYCRCDIRGTESILIEPYLPVRDRRPEENEEDDEDEEEDHEDVELVMKKLACMKKVRVLNCGIRKLLVANLKPTSFLNNLKFIEYFNRFDPFTYVFFNIHCALFVLSTALRKKGTKAVTGAVPSQKVHFCTQRLHIGTLVVHIST